MAREMTRINLCSGKLSSDGSFDSDDLMNSCCTTSQSGDRPIEWVLHKHKSEQTLNGSVLLVMTLDSTMAVRSRVVQWLGTQIPIIGGTMYMVQVRHLLL